MTVSLMQGLGDESGFGWTGEPVVCVDFDMVRESVAARGRRLMLLNRPSQPVAVVYGFPSLLALQLHFDMSALCFCLMCSSPERPSDDELWSDAFARKARRDTADFLHRPADQRSCDFTAGFVAALSRILFGGDRLVASATAFA